MGTCSEASSQTMWFFKLTDGTVASATVQPIIPTLHAAYRVYEHPWGDSGHQQVRASVYGGLRIYDVRVEVEVATLNEGIDNTWADPIVGVWVPVDLSRRWFVEVSAGRWRIRPGFEILLEYALRRGVSGRPACHHVTGIQLPEHRLSRQRRLQGLRLRCPDRWAIGGHSFQLLTFHPDHSQVDLAVAVANTHIPNSQRSLRRAKDLRMA